MANPGKFTHVVSVKNRKLQKPEAMEYQKKPCSECPFRKESTKGWLGGFSVPETLQAAGSEYSFECHLTRSTVLTKECAGRLLFASKTCKSFRNKDLEAAREVLEKSNSLEDILGFEFSQHHTI